MQSVQGVVAGMMGASVLTERVTVQRVETAVSDTGMVTETWTDVATVWAGVREESGRERLRGGRIGAEKAVLVMMRRRTDVTERERIVWRGRVLGIDSVREADASGRRMWIEITCTEG